MLIRFFSDFEIFFFKLVKSSLTMLQKKKKNLFFAWEIFIQQGLFTVLKIQRLTGRIKTFLFLSFSFLLSSLHNLCTNSNDSKISKYVTTYILLDLKKKNFSYALWKKNSPLESYSPKKVHFFEVLQRIKK